MFAIDKDVSFKDLDDHAIVVNIRTGFYFSLNGTATAVFHGIRQGQDVDDIARELTKQYVVSETDALTDVHECIDTLIKEHIVIEKDG